MKLFSKCHPHSSHKRYIIDSILFDLKSPKCNKPTIATNSRQGCSIASADVVAL